MKKSLMLSLALLTIGSALHAGKGAAFGGGLATGFVAGSILNNARSRDVVYVSDSDQIKELQKENKELKRELRRRRKERNHRRSY